MAKETQGSNASETRISVDMNAADPDKAVTRTSASSDISRGVRDDADTDKPRTKAEKELFKRMGRLERNLTRQFDQRQAERDAAHQLELSELRAKLDKVSEDRSGDDAADVAHEAALGALKAKLEAAYEKGDSAASAAITLEISQLDAKFWAKKAQAAGVVTRETADKDKGKTQAAGQTNAQQRQGKGPTAAGSRFITANEEWWDDPAFEMEQSAANTIYLRLVEKEGFDPKSDETFKEIAKQVKVKFPKLDIRAGRDDPGPGDDDDDDDEEARQQQTQDQGRHRRAAAANVQDRGPANNSNRGGQRVLTKEEMATMQACRLDPNNDRDVVQFLREAASMEASA